MQNGHVCVTRVDRDFPLRLRTWDLEKTINILSAFTITRNHGSLRMWEYLKADGGETVTANLSSWNSLLVVNVGAVHSRRNGIKLFLVSMHCGRGRNGDDGTDFERNSEVLKGDPLWDKVRILFDGCVKNALGGKV